MWRARGEKAGPDGNRVHGHGYQASGRIVDIHGGGADYLPPSRKRIAQSEAYTGKTLCPLLVHNGFISIDKERVEVSRQFFTIRDILENTMPSNQALPAIEPLRSPTEFSHEQLRDAESSLDRFYSCITD